jgi:hypothetical protein
MLNGLRPGPKGCDENGLAAALLVGHVSVQISFLLAGGPFCSQQNTSYFEDRHQVAGEVHKFLQQSSLLPYRTIRLISIDALGGSF